MESGTNCVEENIVIEGEDRFTSLPKDVGHHILSFLSIEDIGKLSFASKTCEKLCLTVPSLDVNESSISFPKESFKRMQFMDFITSFMRRRRSTEMKRLSVHWLDLTHTETTRVMSLLNLAMGCNANEIGLFVNPVRGTFVIPLELLLCESLRYLTIGLSRGLLSWPSLYGFSALRKLQLQHLEINYNEHLGERISSSCKLLEVLVLKYIRGMEEFKISSSSLLEIDIASCQLDHLDVSAQSLHTFGLHNSLSNLSSRSCRLNIQAPSLLNLCTSGVPSNYFCVKKSKLNYSVRLSVLHPPYPRKRDELQKLLSSIAQATDLITDFESIKVLYETICLRFKFDSLRSLVLLYDDKLISLLALAHFLQRLPHSLKKLYIRPDHKYFDTRRQDVVFLETENILLVDDMRLEVVEIDITREQYDEDRRLVERLLENAKRLTKMT